MDRQESGAKDAGVESCWLNCVHINKLHEALETGYIRIFGERRFSEYDSFQGSVTIKKSTGV